MPMEARYFSRIVYTTKKKCNPTFNSIFDHIKIYTSVLCGYLSFSFLIISCLYFRILYDIDLEEKYVLMYLSMCCNVIILWKILENTSFEFQLSKRAKYTFF